MCVHERERENERSWVMRVCLYVHESALKFMRGGSHAYLATALQSFHSLQPRVYIKHVQAHTLTHTHTKIINL